MKVGILGYAGVGKTTVFSALTGQVPSVNIPGESHLATVEVADPRLEQLRGVFQPRKYTPARFDVEDLVPLPRGDLKGKGEVLASLREPEALLIVVGCFEEARMQLPDSLHDAAAQLQSVRDDLLLLDLELVEKRVARIQERLGKGGGDRDAMQRELKYVEAVQAALESGDPLPEPADKSEERLDAELRLFRRKATVVVVNAEEGRGRDDAGGRGARRDDLRAGRGRDRAARRRGPRGVPVRVRPQRAGQRAPDPFGLRGPGSDLLLHRRRGRGARVADRPGLGRGHLRREDPHRSRARLHPGRGHALRRSLRGHGPARVQGGHAAGAQGQGLRGRGRRHPQHPVQRGDHEAAGAARGGPRSRSATSWSPVEWWTPTPPGSSAGFGRSGSA